MRRSVPGSDPRLSPVAVKVTREDRREVAARKQAGEGKPAPAQ